MKKPRKKKINVPKAPVATEAEYQGSIQELNDTWTNSYKPDPASRNLKITMCIIGIMVILIFLLAIYDGSVRLVN